MHRDLIEGDAQYDGGVYCDEESVLQRNGNGIEKEADEFAATLLIPLMRLLADEFDRLREHGRIIKMSPEEKRFKVGLLP